MKTHQIIRFLNKLHLYNPVRDAYFLFERFAPRVRKFYAPFICPGDLCFDIGANIGRMTDIFLQLGANVIAVEPNPDCLKYLTRKYHNNYRVCIVSKALADSQGKCDLRICETNAFSSLSDDWIKQFSNCSLAGGFTWRDRVAVTTTTLEDLIKTFGTPQFCKIDVEGYELNVLRGLDRPINHLCFEVAPMSRQAAEEGIGHLCTLGDASFNFVQGSTLKFHFPEWMEKESFIYNLNQLKTHLQYGDIYVRFAQNQEA